VAEINRWFWRGVCKPAKGSVVDLSTAVDRKIDPGTGAKVLISEILTIILI
jgi:hypothetical protein